MPSCFKLMPGLEDDVMARAPAAAAPKTILMAASSDSDWMKTPPVSSMRLAMYAVSSFCGVIG
jgi:hypothetical protein